MLNKYLSKGLFVVTHLIACPSFFNISSELSRTKSRNELLSKQEEMLTKMVRYAYENIKYYHNIFGKYNLKPQDIKTAKDMYKLPVLTKEDIKKHWEDFKPTGLKKTHYKVFPTGGTTGIPLFYRVSKEDRFLSLALLYRGWGLAGYEFGDPVVFIGGASISVDTSTPIFKFLHERATNIRKLSSFDMSDQKLSQYIKIINTFKPKFIRGYPSAIYYLSQWVHKNNSYVNPIRGIFTTSEKLFPNMRSSIEEVFNCRVFDGYGLNDGGLSAYECREHRGMHVDTERSLLEICDERDSPMVNKEGRILATNLMNKAMPLIRYDTGDLGILSNRICTCGNNHPMLENIIGRSVDILTTPEGKKVHGWFFLYTFWKYNKGIRQYQVVQRDTKHINIKIVKENGFDPAILDIIRKTAASISKGWHLDFHFVDRIEPTKSGKRKFIISEIETYK
jgi:phenylacetate-CoA ligase